MTIGSLGLRSSGSYGSLQQQQFQFQNGSLPNQTTPPVNSRKPGKMVKEKERLFPWIFKFAPRKKVGMLLLCSVSAAVFLWVLYVGKGEDAPESSMKNIRFNSTLDYNGFPPVPVQNETFKVGMIPGEDAPESSMKNIRFNSTLDYNGFPPVPVQNETFKVGTSSEENIVEGNATLGWLLSPPPPPLPPPPPPPPPPLVYFTGYTLPPGNPCEGFTLPPPPADPKRTGPRPCPVCYLPMEQVLGLIPDAPSFSPVLKSLTYIHEENLTKTEFGGSEFGGYPSLAQRNDSYDIRESMSVHCGFVRGVKPGQGTGFDIDDSDLLEMETCQGVVVASAIFGAFDLIRQPKNISDYAKKNVCFYMFVDEETEAFLRNSSAVDSNKKSGLWQIVVVRNLPYTDPRRSGKVPKLLIHRLFPNARYSLWIDGKLQLVVDPYQVLERFLWRKNATFAISRHYRRFDVFVEAEANKVAGKYENASIDFQIEFYKKEGLTPYSLVKLPITSDVPEGCVIIREHVPISNLFTCLWFNEVDRFTSRDQISFSTVRDKINSKTNWTINMFLDCERRNFVVQGYHRDVLESRGIHPPIAIVHPPPPIMEEQPKKTVPEVLAESIGTPSKKIPTKRARDRKSKRHRKVAAGSKEITSS